MKDFRFYKEWEYQTKQGTFGVIAINTTTLFEDRYDGFAPPNIPRFSTTNPSYGTTIICKQYLKENCTRISEKEARELAPQLFEVLEYDPDLDKTK